MRNIFCRVIKWEHPVGCSKWVQISVQISTLDLSTKEHIFLWSHQPLSQMVTSLKEKVTYGVHMDTSIVKVQVTYVRCTWTLLLSRYKSPMYGAHGRFCCQGTSHLCMVHMDTPIVKVQVTYVGWRFFAMTLVHLGLLFLGMTSFWGFLV